MVDLTVLETGSTDCRAKTIKFPCLTAVVCLSVVLEGHSSAEEQGAGHELFHIHTQDSEPTAYAFLAITVHFKFNLFSNKPPSTDQ